MAAAEDAHAEQTERVRRMIVADISYAQDPVIPEEMAPRIDALLVRWTDWKAWARGDGDDTYYNFHLKRFRELGVSTSGYFFARPEMAGAKEQIDTWAVRTTETFDFPPMLDVETVGLTGPPLQEWVDTALDRMREIWGWPPLYYFSGHLSIKLDIVRPHAPHLLMVPGFPYKDTERTRYPAGREREWVDLAGGPDVGPGYVPLKPRDPGIALWQFTETGNLPGTGNVVDISHAYEPFISLLRRPPNPTRCGDLMAILRVLAPLVETGRAAQPVVATAIGELRRILTPEAADVLVAAMTQPQ
jgi:hypothetical protein